MLRALTGHAFGVATGVVADVASAGRSVGRSVANPVVVLGRAGILQPYSPLTLARLGLTLSRWGTGLAGGYASLAVRFPDRTALVDESGELTVAELHARTNALAHQLRERGVREGDLVAVLCRNHRGFVEATVAVAKLGADVIFLNTAFAGPQLVEILDRESPVALIHDDEFATAVGEAAVSLRLIAWSEGAAEGTETLEQLIATGSRGDLTPPGRTGRIVVLTSGTTGAPKGAPRSEAGIAGAVSILGALPLRQGGRTYVAAPLFHTWGLAHLALATLLGSTVVLRRRFEPEELLRTIEEERCDAVAVVPVMLQRVLQLPAEVLDHYRLDTLRVVASSGSALAGDLATEWMDRFGDTLYSTYGSTEVAHAAVAGPADLRACPGTAGRPPYAVTVRILDDDGVEVATGETGRIFVGNGLLFEGYTGGGSKEVLDGLMATGDVGRLDAAGRLFVEGRDDEMIVSGGENVFPQEVEDCLARHPAVREAAAVGVEDAEFGARLRAFVVPLDTSGRIEEDELKAWVRDHLARYKVPREIVFLEELPRNATGKVLKRDLVEAKRSRQRGKS
ncbi:AMP-binding protein [Nocardioides sp. GXZ039]|uniref:AMP-binding protein n=1 Tax=Nocardioides sp. GXZ039 TaxID=3136018 RepID=UPI0030F45715